MHHMLEVVANGDLVATLAEEISRSSGKQGGEGHAEIPLSRKLVDSSPANCGPHECVHGSIHHVAVERTCELSLALSGAAWN